MITGYPSQVPIQMPLDVTNVPGCYRMGFNSFIPGPKESFVSRRTIGEALRPIPVTELMTEGWSKNTYIGLTGVWKLEDDTMVRQSTWAQLQYPMAVPGYGIVQRNQYGIVTHIANESGVYPVVTNGEEVTLLTGLMAYKIVYGPDDSEKYYVGTMSLSMGSFVLGNWVEIPQPMAWADGYGRLWNSAGNAFVNSSREFYTIGANVWYSGIFAQTEPVSGVRSYMLPTPAKSGVGGCAQVVRVGTQYELRAYYESILVGEYSLVATSSDLNNLWGMGRHSVSMLDGRFFTMESDYSLVPPRPFYGNYFWRL